MLSVKLLLSLSLGICSIRASGNTFTHDFDPGSYESLTVRCQAVRRGPEPALVKILQSASLNRFIPVIQRTLWLISIRGCEPARTIYHSYGSWMAESLEFLESTDRIFQGITPISHLKYIFNNIVLINAERLSPDCSKPSRVRKFDTPRQPADIQFFVRHGRRSCLHLTACRSLVGDLHGVRASKIFKNTF